MDALRNLTRLAATATLVVGLSTTVFAQPPGGGPPRGGRGFGGPPGGGGVGMLLRAPEVQDELELLDDQKEQLRGIEEEMRDKMRSAFGGRRGGGERPDFEEMRAKFDEMRKEIEGRISEVLTTQQMDRLKQIETQQQVNQGGARALMGGPLADKLGLTEDQKTQLRERAREVQAEMQTKMDAARAEAREKLMEVLTSEQREKLTAMMGAEFTMSEQPQGPPGRDRGGRRGGQRGGRPGPPPPPPGDGPEL